MKQRLSVWGMRHLSFDLWNGVKTAEGKSLTGLTIRSSHRSDATWYEPADPKVLKRALASLDIDYAKYVFVDIGSGEGRAVLIASGYPFKKATGVEFALELHNAALENARSWRRKTKCGSVNFVLGDALEFEIPRDACVILLNNPFGENMLRSVLQNIQQSIDVYPRDIVLLYLFPKHEGALLCLPNVVKLAASRYHAIYRMRPSQVTADRWKELLPLE